MSLKNYISTQYEVDLYKYISVYEKLNLNYCSLKNRTIFLKRCLTHEVIPKFLMNRCPLNTQRSNNITKKYRLALLKKFCKNEKKIFISKKKMEEHRNFLESKLTKED